MEKFEVITVSITAASELAKFEYKPLAGLCTGFDLECSKALTSKSLAEVGLSFNNQKSQRFSAFAGRKDTTGAAELNTFQTIHQPLENNNLITGFVRDLANASPFAAYKVRIILKMQVNDE